MFLSEVPKCQIFKELAKGVEPFAMQNHQRFIVGGTTEGHRAAEDLSPDICPLKDGFHQHGGFIRHRVQIVLRVCSATLRVSLEPLRTRSPGRDIPGSLGLIPFSLKLLAQSIQDTL